MADHVWALILGSYVFTAGCFKWLSDKIDHLAETVNNHHKHELERLDIIVTRLEKKDNERG